MWSLKRDGQGSQNETTYYLTVGEHLVGRKDCQIQITGDQSVSRKHAWITVSQNGSTTAQVSLKDVSKFGCLVNDVKCQNSVVVSLNHDDKVTFGTQNCSYRLKFEPLVVFASCLDNARKKNLKLQLGKLGGYLVNEWQKECSHLVMEELSFTFKVIYALVTCSPIVTPSFFDDLIKAVDCKSESLSSEKYMPPIKEDLIDPKVVSFHPNNARKSVFTGKLFLFLEKKQYKKLEQAVVLAGGKALLKETGDISGCDDNILTDQNTLVMSVNSKPGTSEAKELWIGHVGDVLKRVNRRPIAETEVGLAILHVSLDEYCNSSLHHVPKITKQIVSKSISTMEKMSQRVNESQNISIHQVPDKKSPISLRNGHSKQNTMLATPKDTKKRYRDSSDELQPLVCETPQPSNLESKRRKISPGNVTHVSQTPEPEFKTPGVTKEPSPSLQLTSPTNTQTALKTRNEKLPTSKKDTTHISQNEDCQLDDQSTVCASESHGIGLKRKATSYENDITHVSQSQNSQHDEKPKSSPRRLGGKKRLTSSNVDVTHISQSQASQHGEKPPNAKLNEKYSHDITHISQSQSSQVNESGAVLNENQRAKRNASDDEVTFVPERQTSPTVVNVKETPSPEMSLPSKRRKISSPDITHVSDTERSMIAEQQLCLSSVSSPISGGIKLGDCPSSCTENAASTSFSDDQTSRQPTDSTKDTVDRRKDTEKASHREELDEKELSSINKSTNHGYDLYSDQSERETISKVQDLSTIKSAVSPLGSGWMSKKSFCVKKEKSETNLSVRRASMDDGGIEELDAHNFSGNAPKESQGFLSKQEDHGEIVVKEEQNSEIPNDLLCVEHIELVVVRPSRPKTQQSQKKFSTKLKNMKKFRKQNYAGDDHGLPRIIGGSDLVVFSSKNGNIEDWMGEIEAMHQQEQEDRDADRLFQYEPIGKRRNRR